MDRWHPRRAGSIEIREIDEPGLQLFTGDSHLAFHTVINRRWDLGARSSVLRSPIRVPGRVLLLIPQPRPDVHVGARAGSYYFTHDPC